MSAIEDINALENLKLAETEAGTGDITTQENNIILAMATTFPEVLESINRVGYKGPLLNESDLKKALVEGPKNIEFTKLVSFITNEIGVLRSLDECVNAISTPEDSATFIMEISSFLKELGCPFSWLSQGHASDRLSSEQDKLLLLEYLSMEVIMARIHRERNPQKKIELKLHESPQAADLRKMLQTFSISKPPPNITMKTLMQKLIPIIKTTAEKAGPDLLGHPILNATLTPKKWESVYDIQQNLHDDFRIRREMLLKRLDCTIQSFQWSNKTKGKEDQFNQIYTEKRKLLKAEPDVDISDLLSARDDLAIIEKTSSASVRKNTKSAVNSVIIGQVPDRGGRTSEQAPPPPEMPAWQQRNTGSAGGFRGGRGGNTGYSRGGGQQSSFGGGNSYSRGGGQQSSFGGGNSYSQSGSTFSSGNNYSTSANSYARDSYKSADSYRGSNSARGSYDSAGSYGRNDSYSQGSSSSSSYDYKKGNSDNYAQGNYSSNAGYASKPAGGYSQGGNRSGFDSNKSGGYSLGDSRGGYDSAGNYGGYSQDSKRPKTLDQYQPNKTSYADEYVQESSRNQQYQARGDSRGSYSGKSNYNRGGSGRGGYK